MKKLTKSKVWYAVSMMLLLIAVLICVQNIITFSTEEIDAAILDGQYCLDAKVDSKYNIEEVSNALLGDVSIAKCEYLYSLDDSADYIYVEFENGGYAIYLKQTMEMLEYSAKGTLKYAGFTSKKYYGGPNIYLVKDNDSFFDTVSNQEIKISRESAKIYSSAIRDKLLINYNMRTELNSTEYDYSLVDYDNTGFEINKTESGLSVSKPNLDTNSLIIIPEDDGTYIPNYRYFLHDPTHGWNSTGTCGAVAAQILLSYHNYYTDRRIINNRYLNGDIINKNANPNLCVDPMIMTSHTLGTRGSREDGSDDPNSYFAYIVKKIPANATTSQMVNGIKGVFSERNGEIDATINYSIDSKIGNKIVDTGKVKSEIDCGRPAILLMQKSLGGADHYVVAYGYCNYDYHNSSDSYSGFITHFG